MSAQTIAEAFVRARRERLALPDFPGDIPSTLAGAYAVQDAALALWAEQPVGWKVGRIADDLIGTLGAGRLVGPIFAGGIWNTGPSPTRFPVFSGGFAAVEAEFVAVLRDDAPIGQQSFTPAEAKALTADLHIGVETAGSPLATINELGPLVVISDFGNNAGLILGPVVAGWRDIAEAQLTAETFIDGYSVGTGGALSLPGGLWSGLAFALEMAAKRGRPLKRGALVSTGATTGVHEIAAGQSARLVFNGLGEIFCEAVSA